MSSAIEDFLNDAVAPKPESDTIEPASDRWGRHVYTDDLPPCPLAPSGETVNVLGVTSQIKPIKNSFEEHAATTVATWAVENHAIWKDLDRDAAIALVAGERKRALDRAAGRGLSIHKVVDAAREGKDQLVVTNPDAAPYLAAVKAFLKEARPEFVLGEVAVFNRTLNYGGKFDVAMRLGAFPDLGLCIGDWKTRAKHQAYADNAAQLGGYANAEYFIKDGRRHPMPTFDSGVVVTFTPDGTWALHPVDLEKAWELCRAAIGCYQIDKALKPIGKKIVAAPDDSDALTDLEQLLDPTATNGSAPPVETPAVDDLEAMLAAPAAPGAGERGTAEDEPKKISVEDFLPTAIAALGARLKAAVEAGTPAALIRWPAGVPTFKQGGPTTWDQVLEVEQCVLAAEKEIGAPFTDMLPKEPGPLGRTPLTLDPPPPAGAPKPAAADPADVDHLRAVNESLPLDLQVAAKQMVTDHDVPGDPRRWTAEHVPIVRSTLEVMVARGVERVHAIEHIAAEYDEPTMLAAIYRVAGADDVPAPTAVDGLTFEALQAVVHALDVNHLAFSWDEQAQPVIGLTPAGDVALTRSFKNKTALIAVAKDAAARHGLPAPRSAAAVASEPLLVALVLYGPDESTPASQSINQEGSQT